MQRFEQQCKLSNGYVSSIRRSIGPEKLEHIRSNYPDLNITWLLTGEGPMLTTMPSITQTAHGDNNMQVAGSANRVHAAGVDELLAELAEQRKVTQKAQEQVDRLLTIMERMQDFQKKE